jgi:DNA-binding FrmR family transcriptional regulator
MKLQNQEAKANLTVRLKRIEGQVRGVTAMLEDERDCREIMQQLTSIHSAVQSASRAFFQEYATACLANMEDESLAGQDASLRRQELIREMIAMLDKTP